MESTYLSWSPPGVHLESIRSPSGVYLESIRSLPGVHQEYQDFIRTPDGVHQDAWGSVTYSLAVKFPCVQRLSERVRLDFKLSRCWVVLPSAGVHRLASLPYHLHVLLYEFACSLHI